MSSIHVNEDNLLKITWTLTNAKSDDVKSEPALAGPAKTTRIGKLHSTMFGLIYPAVLGSALVWALMYVNFVVIRDQEDPLIYQRSPLGLMFIVFFLVSFFSSQKDALGNYGFCKYNCWMFLLDFLEVISMYAAFILLGFFSSFGKNIEIQSFEYLELVYILFLFNIILHIIWRWLGAKKSEGWTQARFLLPLRVLGALICISAAIFQHLSFTNFVAPALIITLVVLYASAPGWVTDLCNGIERIVGMRPTS